MQIHQVRGRSMRDALERARDEYGEGALVLTHRAASGGAVTLALSTETPRSPEVLTRLQGAARELLERHVPRADTQDIERCLRLRGASQRLTERICEAVAGRLPDGGHPLDLAGEELGVAFPVARSERRAGTTTVLAFLGRAGVGKTTSIAKLAARLREGGRAVLLTTLDTHRVGAVEQMKAYGRHLACPVLVLKNSAGLLRVLSADRRPAVVLLDTTGNLDRDGRALDQIQAALQEAHLAAHMERYLVLPATTSQGAMDEAADLARADGCVLTKLDETRVPAPVLEFAMRRKLPIAFLCDGPEIGRNFHQPKPECFADLMLRGRIS